MCIQNYVYKLRYVSGDLEKVINLKIDLKKLKSALAITGSLKQDLKINSPIYADRKQSYLFNIVLGPERSNAEAVEAIALCTDCAPGNELLGYFVSRKRKVTQILRVAPTKSTTVPVSIKNLLTDILKTSDVRIFFFKSTNFIGLAFCNDRDSILLPEDYKTLVVQGPKLLGEIRKELRKR